MNLSERLIASGFKVDTLGGGAFNPKNNWMGASVYQPDIFFDKDNKTVHLSVQGLAMPLPNPITEEFKQVLKNRGARYVGFSVNKEKVYQNWQGILPPDEFIKEFIG